MSDFLVSSDPMDLMHPERLMTPREVAAVFCVSPKTVSRWGVDGKLQVVKTLGGHRRFLAEEVERLRAQLTEPSS